MMCDICDICGEWDCYSRECECGLELCPDCDCPECEDAE